MKAWYALYTKPNAEAQVARTLAAPGLERVSGAAAVATCGRARPFFPAYFFVRCDLAVVGIENLQWIPGLRRILSFDGRPAVVPDGRRADQQGSPRSRLPAGCRGTIPARRYRHR